MGVALLLTYNVHHPLTHFRYVGYVLSRQSGFWSSTVLSLFVGVVLAVIAIYTRQRNVSLLPAAKASQD